MDEFTLRWQIVGPGSAVFTWNFPQEAIEIHTTYVGDGLESLLQAAIDLRIGSSSSIAYLPSEPGGTFLFFGGADVNAYLQVVDFANMASERRRWSGGSLRWHGFINVNHFLRQVVLMAEDVLVQCGGDAAYLKAWGGIPFPADKLEVLRKPQ